MEEMAMAVGSSISSFTFRVSSSPPTASSAMSSSVELPCRVLVSRISTTFRGQQLRPSVRWPEKVHFVGGASKRYNSCCAEEKLQIDLNLPRRSLLVEFTCNKCSSRTQRLINPEAYRRGTVFVQCAKCEAYHKLVDNLDLIQEYHFSDEIGVETTGDVELKS